MTNTWADFLALDQAAQINRAMDVLGDVVDTMGHDYVYHAPKSQCVYVHEGQCSCLIGHCLVRLGLDIPSLVELDQANYGSGVEAASLDAALGVHPAVALAWSRAQRAQDNGQTWGDALDKALAFAESWERYDV